MHSCIAVISKTQDIENLLNIYQEKEVPLYISCTKEERIQRIRDLQKRIKDSKNSFNKEYVEEVLSLSSEEEMLEFDAEEGNIYDDLGNEFSTRNPLGKWDWWAIGGRWDKALHTKQGNYVDSAIIRNIDFSPNNKDRKEAEKQWDTSSYTREKYPNKKDYIKMCTEFKVFAIITPDGMWHEGLDHKETMELINTQNPNHYLTIVDIHS